MLSKISSNLDTYWDRIIVIGRDIWYHYDATYFLIRAVELPSISKDPPAHPLVIERMANILHLKIEIHRAPGEFISLRVHSFQLSLWSEDSYRLLLDFSAGPVGSRGPYYTVRGVTGRQSPRVAVIQF